MAHDDDLHEDEFNDQDSHEESGEQETGTKEAAASDDDIEYGSQAAREAPVRLWRQMSKPFWLVAAAFRKSQPTLWVTLHVSLRPTTVAVPSESTRLL